MRNPFSSLPARRAAGALFAVLGLASVTAVVAGEPLRSDQFAAGWQDKSRPMINRGIGPDSKAVWYAPANLPRGHYVLINRKGDQAEVIDGYQFDVTSNASRDINVLVPMGYGYVEAIPSQYVPESRRVGQPPLFQDGPT
jgi:hypothetical protein